jgi:succinate dehydrogenase/fumarate reductase cytochrome b subunit
MDIEKKVIRKLHRVTGVILGTFIVLHLSNHLIALGGIDLHIQTMNLLRKFYRNPFIEPVLLFSILLHIFSGIGLIWKTPKGNIWLTLQKVSGAYLAFFLFMHLSGVLGLGRFKLDVDTNFYFASTPLLTVPYKYLFIPYYALAVISFFVHSAYILSRRGGNKGLQEGCSALSMFLIVIGVGAAGLIVATMSGVFYDITIPENYSRMFE